jgi:hypothetical protein
MRWPNDRPSRSRRHTTSVSPDLSAARVLASIGRAVLALPRRPHRRQRVPVHRLAAPSSGRPSRSARSRPDAAGRLGRPGHHPAENGLLGLLRIRFCQLRGHRRCRRLSRTGRDRKRVRRAARRGEFRRLILSDPFAARKPLRGGPCVLASYREPFRAHTISTRKTAMILELMILEL